MYIETLQREVHGGNNKKMSNKISLRLNGIEKEWSELDQHIDCTKSEFLRQCIVKQCNKKDSLTEVKRDIEELYYEKKRIEEEILEKEELAEDLEKIYAFNANNRLVMDALLETCKTVAMNEGLTEERVIAIANDKVNYKILIKKLKDEEGITILDENKIKKQFVKTKDGDSVLVTTPFRKEKSSFEILYDNFMRRFRSDKTINDPIDFLEKNKEIYMKMCDKRPDITYKEFKNKLKTYKMH